MIIYKTINKATIYSRHRPLIKLFAVFILLISSASAQIKDTTTLTPIKIFEEVKLNSYSSNKSWQEIPASVVHLDGKQLQMIATTSLLPALNTIPGIRMEQRSPESFRLSMRGSVLRSPFGVRDVKVYWNGLPISDGGGNTYLNLINLTQINSLEVIKGNTASMYGAGIGGVLLLNSHKENFYDKPNAYSANISGGSFGLLEESASWQHSTYKYWGNLIQSHEQSNGYRQQSASQKDNITYNSTYKTKRNKLDFITFYTHQYYETPGGLTLMQLQQDPTLARTASNNLPSAIQQKTSIYNNTPFIGLHDVFLINKYITNDVAVVYNHTNFKNPFITDYEIRSETNLNIKESFAYKHSFGKTQIEWINGGELMNNHAIIEDDGNLNGIRDTVQFKDNVFINQWFAFSQAQISYKKWIFQFGASGNIENFRFRRLTDGSIGFTHKNTNLAMMPRVSIGYSLSTHCTIFGDLSRGFSPPTLAEIRASNRLFNTTLQAEDGWGAQLGLKGAILHKKLTFDVDIYRMHIENAIVLRNNANGTTYYINAGNTKQDGLEVYLKYKLFRSKMLGKLNIDIVNSYAYQPYKFLNYQQGSNNYSGNNLTGVPQNVNVTGLQVYAKKGYYLHISHTYTSPIPLTDANDVLANAYHLLQLKGGWQVWYRKLYLDFYIGGDNLLNEQYSLGNDINAAGKRFYNPAATINFYGGCKLNW